MKILISGISLFLFVSLLGLKAQNSQVKFPIYSLGLKFDKPKDMVLVSGLQKRIKIDKILGLSEIWSKILHKVKYSDNGVIFIGTENKNQRIYFNKIIDTDINTSIMEGIIRDTNFYSKVIDKLKFQIIESDSGSTNIGKFHSLNINFSASGIGHSIEMFIIKSKSSILLICFYSMDHLINLSIINSLENLYNKQYENIFLESIMLLKDKKWEQYKEKVDEGILIDPQNTNAYCRKVGILLCEKKFEEALASTDTLLLRDDHNVNGFICKAIAYDKLGKLTEAIHNFDIAMRYIQVSKHTNDQNEYYIDEAAIKRIEGEIYLQLNEFEMAKKYSQESARESHDSLEIAYNLKNLGLIEVASRNFNNAIYYYNLAKLWVPYDNKFEIGQIYLFSGITLESNRDYENALKDFNTVLKDDPENEDALIEVGIVKQCQKDFNGAINYFTKIINNKNANSEIAKRALYRRGCAKIAAGKDGCTDLKKAISLGVKDEDEYFEYYCTKKVIKK